MMQIFEALPEFFPCIIELTMAHSFVLFLVIFMSSSFYWEWASFPLHNQCTWFQLQVENEYGYYEGAYGEGGKRYAAWAAQMAVSQNTGVPWIMCQQFDAPPSVVRVYNIPTI